jgi:hypothetical protein
MLDHVSLGVRDLPFVPAAKAAVSQVFGQSITSTTSPPSCSIPTATGWRLSATHHKYLPQRDKERARCGCDTGFSSRWERFVSTLSSFAVRSSVRSDKCMEPTGLSGSHESTSLHVHR